MTRQGTGVADVAVELHRVTRDTAGVITSTRTDGRGGFRFRLPPVDTAAGFAVFFTTAEFLGVRYFGPPLHPGEVRDAYDIAVHDTVAAGSAREALRVASRDIVVLPEPQGGWEVNEILQLLNPNEQTLVAPDGGATWQFRIPADAFAFEVGDGEMDRSGIVRMDDRVLVTDPLVPGTREIFVRYRVPGAAAALSFPVTAATGAMNLLVATPAPPFTVSGLGRAEPFQADGRTFDTYRSADLPAGTDVMMAWRAVGPAFDPRYAALAVLGVLLLVGLVAAVRRNGRNTPGPGSPTRPAVRVGTVATEPAEDRELVS